MKKLFIVFALFLAACERDLTAPSFDIEYRGYESGITAHDSLYFAKPLRAVFNKKAGLVKVYRIDYNHGLIDTLQTVVLTYRLKGEDFILGGLVGRQAAEYVSYFDTMEYWFEREPLVWYMDGIEYRTDSITFFGKLEDI